VKKDEIQIGVLRHIISKMFDHIQQDLKVEHLRLDHDYYHDFSLGDELYDVMNDPKSVIGQLFDDWEFTKNLESRPKEECVSFMFDHVAPLLRYIAYRIGQ